jgi:hypothetical protein
MTKWAAIRLSRSNLGSSFQTLIAQISPGRDHQSFSQFFFFRWKLCAGQGLTFVLVATPGQGSLDFRRALPAGSNPVAQ